MVSAYSSPFAPIPGSGPPPRGLFVDRWGTLLELPDKGYCARFDQAEFTEGAVDSLFRAAQANWNVYLLGNEDSVAFGKLAADTWHAFEKSLLGHLKGHGVPVKRCYACLDNPEGKKPHNNDSVYLLPNTGALYHAAQTDGVELRQSWVIGDSTLELVAGWRAGSRLASVATGLALSDGELHVEPELSSATLAGVVDEILAKERSNRW